MAQFKKQSFAQRLWNLLRIRQGLTASAAADLLADADAVFDWKKSYDKATRYLRAWHKQYPANIQLVNKKLNGSNFYVLARDMGENAPHIILRPGQIYKGSKK